MWSSGPTPVTAETWCTSMPRPGRSSELPLTVASGDAGPDGGGGGGGGREPDMLGSRSGISIDAREVMSASLWMDISSSDSEPALGDRTLGGSAAGVFRAATIVRTTTYPASANGDRTHMEAVATRRMHYASYLVTKHVGDWQTMTRGRWAALVNGKQKNVDGLNWGEHT